VRFWDSSALVPLLLEEPRSSACRAALRADRTIVVWCLSRTEIVSALWRRHRAGSSSSDDVRAAEGRLRRLSSVWHEVDDVDAAREQAERLLRVHALRAADALQLAAARLATDDRPRGQGLVSLDDALLEAAHREGFEAIRPAG